jgi:tetratricopeptide (TPR) repeat protein
MGILVDIPDDIKQRLRNSLVDYLARLVETVPGAENTAGAIRQLSSQAVFYNAYDKAVKNALKRFIAEYNAQDKDLVDAISNDGHFWKSKNVRHALMELVTRQGAWLVNEHTTVVQHFVDILPERIDRERVDKAVNFLLRCILEELWTLPGVKEIREIYNLQFQKMNVETARQQVALMEAQLQATTQLSSDVREALLQLATTLEQRLLSAPPPQPTLPGVRPYHNLFQPDYPRFIGRQKELDWLRQRLSPNNRTWQIVITGIGGVGKSSLALAVAHDYREQYDALPPEERFEAIIWITAKEEVLTIKGRKQSSPSGLIFRTLEDIYTTIAQTLEREDITRTISGEQDLLVQKALSAQRTLLIVDNMESVTDERVHAFLNSLPVPTKCIITSREWVDVAAVLKLTGMPQEEAERLIIEEAMAREVKLNEAQRQQLFKRTAGLPLPIKLSLARKASGETLDQVLRWLGNATGDLPEYCIKGQIDIARQNNPVAFKLLLACSLFDLDAGVSREALGYVTDLASDNRDDGLILLQHLSLLNRDEDDRLWISPMVQEYSGAELARTNYGEALTERWLTWLLKYSQKYGIKLNLYVERSPMMRLEYPNLRSAIRWCHEYKRWEMLIHLVEGTWSYLYLVGLFGELREILELALQAVQALQDMQHEGLVLHLLGLLYNVQGEYEKALEYLDKAEEVARRYKDVTELGHVVYVRSKILTHQGHIPEAEKLARSLLEIGEQLNDRELKILAVHRLAQFETAKQQYDKALEWLARGEQWSRELNASHELAWNIYHQGATLIEQGNTTRAESYLIESLNMATSWGMNRLIAHNEHSLAQVYANNDRLQLALQMAENARDRYERLGMARDLAELKELIRKLQARDNHS